MFRELQKARRSQLNELRTGKRLAKEAAARYSKAKAADQEPERYSRPHIASNGPHIADLPPEVEKYAKQLARDPLHNQRISDGSAGLVVESCRRHVCGRYTRQQRGRITEVLGSLAFRNSLARELLRDLTPTPAPRRKPAPKRQPQRSRYARGRFEEKYFAPPVSH